MEPNRENKHKKWSVILAFALPMILIVGVLLSSNVSFFEPKTQYDFIYAVCDVDSGRYYYQGGCRSYLNDVVKVDDKGHYYTGEVNPDRDSDNDGVLDIDESHQIRYLYHDNQQNISREITEAELRQYTLSSLLTSPDGASLEFRYRSGADVLFVDVNSGGYEHILKKDGRTKVLHTIDSLSSRYNYYDDQFKFVGWVIQ